MLVAYWSAKGGVGTSVLAAAHALTSPGPTVLVDFGGDLPAVLGASVDADRPGVTDWLTAGDHVPTDALDRLTVAAGAGVELLCRGTAPDDPDASDARAEVLAAVLSSGPRLVIVDAGTSPVGPAATLCRAADRSVLVTRACYVGVQRALRAPMGATEIALVREPQRSLRSADIEAALGVPVRAQVTVDPAVARAVDAGLLAARLPRPLRRIGARLGTAT